MFSNDGPYGSQMSEQNKVPELHVSVWQDLNWLGSHEAPVSIGPSGGFRVICWYAPFSLLMIVLLCGAAYYIKLSLRKFAGLLCFSFAGIIIYCMIAGLTFEVAQALMACGSLVFVFVFVFVFGIIVVCDSNLYDNV